jgi:hypothetical protein
VQDTLLDVPEARRTQNRGRHAQASARRTTSRYSRRNAKSI